ncbi:MAG: hypothetical protein MUF13_11900 [Akkermansiaceae bacterium]|nr:hypothetical protein [Akkermansiaceae bacterium]
MFAKIAFASIALVFAQALVSAQPASGSAAVQIRAMLHDPTRQTVDLFVADQNGSVVKLNLLPANLSPAQMTTPVNGSVVFYNTASVDLKKPQDHIVGTLKLPASTRKAIIILLPSAPGSSTFRSLLIDETGNEFPKGESRVLSLVPVETAIEAGEHKLPLASGKITPVPAVKKVNEYNMAQTNFYYKEKDAWVTFTERQIQYLDNFRRIFIIFVPPGGNQPFISTIVDTVPVKIPGAPAVP